MFFIQRSTFDDDHIRMPRLGRDCCRPRVILICVPLHFYFPISSTAMAMLTTGIAPPARTLVAAGASSARRQLGFLQSGALAGGLSLSVPTAEVLPAQHYAASSLPLGMWRSSRFSVQIGEQRELVDISLFTIFYVRPAS